ncbi:glucose PTS transporter transcription antiterminator GlcT [Clostridium chromiireducens]|uniref:PRD domain-containing protein n=1 Tax=Clostridium chromiireducens TaxID=225345 RepID=A0A1V4ISK0_9CLOT|nr:PRD domain-containing protein [Clostridium chromiireducens]MVX65104.1 PRD domain-containing protein [Clostridium chromiireducens]OPJ62992.1 PtsGHI operon antiterminator [Clostridium chromiireducens]RII36437.1 PRD domain-containing protein [Clostridium chromiireducens]
MSITMDSAVVIKSYNNNIVSVEMNGQERILFAKGIGFGKKTGDKIEKGTEVEKVFLIENEDNLRNFKQVIENVDEEFFELCERMISFIADELQEKLDERIHVALVDHLNFAVKRIADSEEIENPFLIEIKALYSTEYSLAERVAKKLQDEININIPLGEIGFIALHIHSARNSGVISNSIKNTYMINSIIEYIEEKMSIKIDKTSLDYARFLTHLKFAIKRISTNISIKNDFIKEIKSKYKISYKIAKGVSKILVEKLEKDVVDDEIAYLAMHIERFRRATLES